MNEDTLKGKWREIKGEVRKAWGKITDDELEQTKGDMVSIGGLIQQRYGDEKDSYWQKLKEIYNRFDEKKDEKVEQVKEALRK